MVARRRTSINGGWVGLGRAGSRSSSGRDQRPVKPLQAEVRNTVRGYGLRRRIGEDRGLFRDRRTFSEVIELTSRVPTNKVAEARRRLEAPFFEKQQIDGRTSRSIRQVQRRVEASVDLHEPVPVVTAW